MTDILLAIIAGLLLTGIVDKTDARTNEVWGKYFGVLISTAIILVVAFAINFIFLSLGVSL